MRGKKIDNNTKSLIIKLRSEEKLTLTEISQKTNIPKGSLWPIIKDFPIPQELQKLKRRPYIIQSNHLKKKHLGDLSKYAKMIDLIKLTGQDKQKIAESAILFRLCLNGYIVYGSPFDGDKADWIIEDKTTRKKFTLQVKWAGIQGGKGHPIINLMCTEGRKQRQYKEGEFDFIIGYCLLNDTAYVFSFDDVGHLKRSVTINENSAEAWEKIRGRSLMGKHQTGSLGIIDSSPIDSKI